MDAIEAFPAPETIFKQRKNASKVEKEEDLSNNKVQAGDGDASRNEKEAIKIDQEQYDTTTTTATTTTTTTATTTNATLTASTKHFTEVDIVYMMQQLRAKFKTIVNQTNRSDLSLRNIMDRSKQVQSNDVISTMKSYGKPKRTTKDQAMIELGPLDEW